MSEEPLQPCPGGSELLHEGLHPVPTADFSRVSSGDHTLQDQENALEEHPEDLTRGTNKYDPQNRSIHNMAWRDIAWHQVTKSKGGDGFVRGRARRARVRPDGLLRLLAL